LFSCRNYKWRDARRAPAPVTESNTAVRRDTVPATLHDLSTTGEDWWGLLGTHGDNKLQPNPLTVIELTTKVARRRHFSKRAG
jgi:hypothetical protein